MRKSEAHALPRDPSGREGGAGTIPTLQALVDALGERGEAPALLHCEGHRPTPWSSSELARRARAVAAALGETGVRAGDRVALFAENRPEWLAACLGIIAAGVVVVPVDAQLGDRALRHVLGDSGVRAAFTIRARRRRLASLGVLPEHAVWVLDAGKDAERSPERIPGQAAATVRAEDIAVLFYTSGTTGPPKGVPLRHEQLCFQIERLIRSGLVSERDRVLTPLPLHHVYPFVVGFLAPLAFGIPVILPESLTGPHIVHALREGGASVLIGVPRLYAALYEAIETRIAGSGPFARVLFRAALGLSIGLRRYAGLQVGKQVLGPVHEAFGARLRVLACGGSALPPDLAWRLEGLGWQLAIGYGLTETAPLLTMRLPGEGRPESVGRPVPGIELRIERAARPGGAAASRRGAREEGEILARGVGVFSGYWGLPEASREAFTPDGWFRTGDLGYFDRHGCLHVTGRRSTLIVTEGGENVQPEDLEEAYQQSPVIREIGVLEEGGKLVALAVPEMRAVPQERDPAEAVRAAVAEASRALPSYQRLSGCMVTRELLPRTRLGKLQRHELARRYQAAKRGEESAGAGALPIEEMSGEDRALLEHRAAEQVWRWLARRYPNAWLTPDTSPQLDLGVDSMAWLNLTLEIRQQTGVELPEDAIARVDTVRDLLTEVCRAGRSTLGGHELRDWPEHILNESQRRWLKPLGPAGTAFAGVLYALNQWSMRWLFRLRVRGAENVPARGPLVLTPNHTSYLDAFVLAAALDPRLLRHTYWSGWVGVMFRSRLIRALSRFTRTIPVDPHAHVFSSLALGAGALKRGDNLVWFPEGRRSPDGRLQPFKPGIAMLLEGFDTTVLPVCIEGAYEALPPQRTLPTLFRRITVIFGRPRRASELAREGSGEDPRSRILDALYRELAELQRAAAQRAS